MCSAADDPTTYGSVPGIYQPQEGVHVGRSPCSACGANYHLHHRVGAALRCPEAYRPRSLEEAQRALAEAVAAGDPAREFVARGEVQRIGGREL